MRPKILWNGSFPVPFDTIWYLIFMSNLDYKTFGWFKTWLYTLLTSILLEEFFFSKLDEHPLFCFPHVSIQLQKVGVNAFFVTPDFFVLLDWLHRGGKLFVCLSKIIQHLVRWGSFSSLLGIVWLKTIPQFVFCPVFLFLCGLQRKRLDCLSAHHHFQVGPAKTGTGQLDFC